MKANQALKAASGMAAMPARVIKSVYNRLLEEQKNLMARKKRLRREDPFADTSRSSEKAAIDTDVNAQVGHERVMGIQNEVDKMLIRVRKSLTAIRLGKYGICENCGKMIDTNRLAINPTAEYCMDCASKLDKSADD
jgi:RNA polymerase-binding transcription factor DksA